MSEPVNSKAPRQLGGQTGSIDRASPEGPLHSQYTSPNPKLIDPATAATLLGIGARSLWTYTQLRAIPSRKIGRSVRYAVAELDAWIGLGCPTERDAADAVLAEVRRIGGGR